MIETPNVLKCYNGILSREKTLADKNLAHHGTATSGFTALYEQHMNYVFRYINYRVGNRSEAEDLTSLVFEKALAAFHRYDSKKAAAQTWLLTIARNTVTDYFRKSSRRNTMPWRTPLGSSRLTHRRRRRRSGERNTSDCASAWRYCLSGSRKSYR